MTKSELLNTFVTQATMMWPEQEMEQEADAAAVADLMNVLTILFKAFLELELPPKCTCRWVSGTDPTCLRHGIHDDKPVATKKEPRSTKKPVALRPARGGK